MQIELLPPNLESLPPRLLIRSMDSNKPFVITKGDIKKLKSKRSNLWSAARKVGVKMIFNIIEDQLIIMKIE